MLRTFLEGYTRDLDKVGDRAFYSPLPLHLDFSPLTGSLITLIKRIKYLVWPKLPGLSFATLPRIKRYVFPHIFTAKT